MDRRAKVELFEQLRREFEFGDGTILGVARKFGVHRRLVRQAIESAVRTARQVQHDGGRTNHALTYSIDPHQSVSRL